MRSTFWLIQTTHTLETRNAGTVFLPAERILQACVQVVYRFFDGNSVEERNIRHGPQVDRPHLDSLLGIAGVIPDTALGPSKSRHDAVAELKEHVLDGPSASGHLFHVSLEPFSKPTADSWSGERLHASATRILSLCDRLRRALEIMQKTGKCAREHTYLRRGYFGGENHRMVAETDGKTHVFSRGRYVVETVTAGAEIYEVLVEVEVFRNEHEIISRQNSQEPCGIGQSQC